MHEPMSHVSNMMYSNRNRHIECELGGHSSTDRTSTRTPNPPCMKMRTKNVYISLIDARFDLLFCAFVQLQFRPAIPKMLQATISMWLIDANEEEKSMF